MKRKKIKNEKYEAFIITIIIIVCEFQSSIHLEKTPLPNLL